jgi:hypothetical protein
MKKLALCGFSISLALLISCGTQSKTVVPPIVSASQKENVSPLVPSELNFAKEFVQLLSDTGWSVKAVHPSKFNGFFRETKKAAFIQTDKGVIEAVFFANDAEVEQIQVNEEQIVVSGYHKYIVQTTITKQRIEGGTCYFNKYRNAFIITSDRELSDALNYL